MGLAPEQSVQSDPAENLLSTDSIEYKMRLINEARRSGIDLENPLIIDINNRTERVVKGQLFTKKNEFKDKKGLYIRKNTAYHIHYTKDLSVYYMTSHFGGHSAFSQLIYPVDKTKNVVEYYNTLNQQEPIYLTSGKNTPTEEDYNAGFYIRSFAKQANDEKAIPFEILNENLNTSPYYIYLSTTWYLTGTIESVQAANNRRVELLAEEWPNMKKYLSNPLQFFRKVLNLSPKEDAERRLSGMIVEEGSSQTENQTQTQTQTQTTSNQSQGAGAMTGPPPGVTTGGAGGYGGY